MPDGAGASASLGTPPGRVRREAAPATRPNKTVNMFISYRHDDRIVAVTLKDVLSTINRSRVNCFLDCESIGSGESWQEKLDGPLQRADWLVAAYTGEQSEYCGYEVGVFTLAKSQHPDTSDSRLACLHDSAELPGLFRNHQTTFVESPTPGVQVADAKTVVAGWPADEIEFYRSSPVFKFLSDVCTYRSLYVARTPKEAEQQRDILLDGAKRITLAFKMARGSNIKSDTPTQLNFRVTFPADPVRAISAIPGTAVVTGTNGTFALFGLMPAMQNSQMPTITWDTLRAAAASRSSTNAFWMTTLEREMLNVAKNLLLGTPEAIFLSATSNLVYRPILTRHTILENGQNEFQIVFVQTLPRQFVGFQKTSLLLAALIQASRFRFAYFEDRPRVDALFEDARTDEEFAINCRQLQYDIGRMETDSAEMGLLDSQALIDAFGQQRRALAESFVGTWDTAKTTLFAALPTGPALDPQDRVRAKGAIETFLQVMAKDNGNFVIAAIEAYKAEIDRTAASVSLQAKNSRISTTAVPASKGE